MNLRHLHALRAQLWLPATALAVACSNQPVAVARHVVGHPGQSITLIPLPAGPYGVAISSVGAAYVTQLLANQVARIQIQLDTPSVGPYAAVGSLPTGVAFNGAGTQAFVTNQGSHSLSVVDVATNAQVHAFPLGTNDPFVTAVAPGDNFAYVTINADSVFTVDVRSGAIVARVGTPGAPNGLAFAPNGATVYVSAFLSGNVYQIDAATHALVRTLRVTGAPQGMAVSPDGAELWVANEAGWLDLVNTTSGAIQAHIPLAGSGFGLAMTPDTAQLWVTEPNASIVEIVSRASRTVIATLPMPGAPRRIAFDPLGKLAVIAVESGWVAVVR